MSVVPSLLQREHSFSCLIFDIHHLISIFGNDGHLWSWCHRCQNQSIDTWVLSAYNLIHFEMTYRAPFFWPNSNQDLSFSFEFDLKLNWFDYLLYINLKRLVQVDFPLNWFFNRVCHQFYRIPFSRSCHAMTSYYKFTYSYVCYMTMLFRCII